MSLSNTFSFIWKHPLSRGRRVENYWRFIAWQLSSRWASGPLVVPFVAGARMRLKRGLSGATGNIYVGLHEFEDMAFVMHVLRPGDLFVDIGANVGSYTVLAGAVSNAHCIAIEPVPETYRWLLGNVEINGIADRVTTLNIALGSEPGVLQFTAHLDAVNHVASHTEMSDPRCINVPVRTLDEVVGERRPYLVKMDVEGFESEVLKGGRGTLADPALHGILMELNGSGFRYGYDENTLVQAMLQLGFRLSRYEPFRRKVESQPMNRIGGGNVLFLRHLDEVGDRVAGATPIDVRGRLV